MFPALSLTPVVTLVKKVVLSVRLSDGSRVNVLFELEMDGDEVITTQLLKLSEDNANEPEQDVFEVLVVTEVVSIASENVTEMLSLFETPLWLSVGEIDSTVGAVVSEVVVVLSVVVVTVAVAEYSSLSSLQEMTVRLKQEIRKMNKNFFIFSSTKSKILLVR